jgi:hypothetical protein
MDGLFGGQAEEFHLEFLIIADEDIPLLLKFKNMQDVV